MMKKNESGRSMVEMLGVLAIIGVLSVGGIAGYTIAMRRYRANEALDMGTKYATLVFSGAVTGTTIGGLTDIASYKTTANSKGLSGYGLVASGVSKYAGAEFSVNEISEDAVKLEITFPSKEVCQTAKSILGNPTATDFADSCAASNKAVIRFQNS